MLPVLISVKMFSSYNTVRAGVWKGWAQNYAMVWVQHFCVLGDGTAVFRGLRTRSEDVKRKTSGLKLGPGGHLMDMESLNIHKYKIFLLVKMRELVENSVPYGVWWLLPLSLPFDGIMRTIFLCKSFKRIAHDTSLWVPSLSLVLTICLIHTFFYLSGPNVDEVQGLFLLKNSVAFFMYNWLSIRHWTQI